MKLNQLTDLFKQAKQHYETQAEYAGQEGDNSLFEMYDSQSKVATGIVEYLEGMQNTEIYLVIALRQLKQQFPDFNITDFESFLLTQLTSIDSEIFKLQKKAEGINDTISQLEELKKHNPEMFFREIK